MAHVATGLASSIERGADRSRLREGSEALSKPADQTEGRIAYLEALRGIGAMQVVLLHFISAFAPGLMERSLEVMTGARAVHLSPLFLVYDGYSAVFLFFVLSGYVLTPSFHRQLDRPASALVARIARLGVPALCSGLIGYGVFMLFGRLNVTVAPMVNSTWFAPLWNVPPGLAATLQASFVSALFDPLFFTEASVNAPLWTMNWEFYGSVLVFLLVWVRSRSAALGWIATALAAAFFLRSFYLSFVIGHALAVLRSAERPPALPRGVAWALLAAGGTICVRAEFWHPHWSEAACLADTAYLAACMPPVLNQEKLFGAAMIFGAVTQLTLLRRALSGPAMAALGRLSFPLYLTHWPVLFGLGSFVFLTLHPWLGLDVSRVIACVAGIAVSFGCARAFQPVDVWSTRLARRIRS